MKLKEFAEKVGLSPTTVSRALGGYPEVREETRQRVMEAALKYGYRPNANAVRLATGRAGAIGCECITPATMFIRFTCTATVSS